MVDWVELQATVVGPVSVGDWCDQCALPSLATFPVVFTYKDDPTRVVLRTTVIRCAEHDYQDE